MRFSLSLILLLTFFAIGCSGASNQPLTPDPVEAKTGNVLEAHSIWGYWQGIIDPDAKTIEFIQAREAQFHLNAIPFLEPPALLNLTLESLEFNGNIITADIGLRHPFLGLHEFSGFDVCGIFIANGSKSGFTDAGIVMAADGDTRLLNPDGYSRWWNPAEFPVNNGTMFAYNDGLLGAPDSVGNFNSTINGYKYFCDDLNGVNDPLDNVTQANRGLFSAGQKNVRRYEIEMGNDGLIFNYAIDACWQFPTGSPPWQAPDDFPMEANRSEAWNVSVQEISNDLWNDGVDNGGSLSLSVDVYDWLNAGQNELYVESQGSFAAVGPLSPIGGGAGFSTYTVDITDATPAIGEIELLLSVVSEVPDFEGFVTGVNTTAYFTYQAAVADDGGFEPADPVLGNVWLAVNRNATETITSLQVSWIDNGEPYFAVYADNDPYDANDTWNYVDEVTLTTAQIDITNMTGFSTDGAYYFTVRARSVSGVPSSESANSEICFIEMEDFDGGDNPNQWTIGYKNSSYKWDYSTNGEIDGSTSLRIPLGPIGYWSVIISDPLPQIPDNEISFIEFAHESTTTWHYSAYTSYAPGHSTTPAPQGTMNTYFDFDGPNDWYTIMDETHGWAVPAGPPPSGGWTPLVTYFGWNAGYKFFGWRLHDAPHTNADISRVNYHWYKDNAPNVRAGFGYGTTSWANLYNWGEIDEIAVIVY